MEHEPEQPEPGKPGPKPKLADPSIREQVYRILATGGSRADAARYVGVSVKTIYNESQRDPEFYQGLRKAEATGKIRLIDVIGKAAATDWRAAAWMLERKYYREWSTHAAHVLVTAPPETKEEEVNWDTVRALRQEMLQDRDYLDWLRHRAVQAQRPLLPHRPIDEAQVVEQDVSE